MLYFLLERLLSRRLLTRLVTRFAIKGGFDDDVYLMYDVCEVVDDWFCFGVYSK
jgi:hypothetical protein